MNAFGICKGFLIFLLIITFLMKNYEKKKQAKGQKNPPQTTRDRYQQTRLIKTFRKRSELKEAAIASMNSAGHIGNFFSKDKQQHPMKIEDSPKPDRKSKIKSPKKHGQTKPIQKVNLASPTYQQSSINTFLQKMRQINNLFITNQQQDPKQILTHIYQSNDNYKSILCEWQKQQLYDQHDRLIYQLVQYFIGVVESTFEKALSQLVNFMELYQSMLGKVEEQQQMLELMNKKDNLNGVLLDKLAQQFTKNVWSTMTFNSLCHLKLDLQNLASGNPQFRIPAQLTKSNSIYQHQPVQNSMVAIATKFPKKLSVPKSQPDDFSDTQSLKSQCTDIRLVPLQPNATKDPQNQDEGII